MFLIAKHRKLFVYKNILKAGKKCCDSKQGETCSENCYRCIPKDTIVSDVLIL